MRQYFVYPFRTRSGVIADILFQKGYFDTQRQQMLSQFIMNLACDTLALVLANLFLMTDQLAQFVSIDWGGTRFFRQTVHGSYQIRMKCSL